MDVSAASASMNGSGGWLQAVARQKLKKHLMLFLFALDTLYNYKPWLHQKMSQLDHSYPIATKLCLKHFQKKSK